MRSPRGRPASRVERRRSRRRLLPSQEVEIATAWGGKKQAFTGVLLNVSGHGLAYRLDDRGADPPPVGSRVQASFELGRGDATFALRAEVVSVTRPRPELMIVGIEFVDDRDQGEQLRTLRETLAQWGRRTCAAANLN